MSTIHLKVDLEVNTIDQLIALEEVSGKKLSALKDALLPFVVGEEGQPIPAEEASKILGSMTMGQLNKTVDELGKSVKTTQDNLVPPTNGS